MLFIQSKFKESAIAFYKKVSHTASVASAEVCASVKRGERRYIVSALALLAAIGTILSFSLTGARFVYKVNYSGKNIAVVRDKNSFNTAKKTVVKMVNGNDVEKEVAKPEYTPAIALAPSISDQNHIVSAIIDNTDGIVEGCIFKVNGAELFTAEKKTLEKCIKKRFEKFRIEGAKCSFEFVEKTDMVKGYFLKKDMLGEDEIKYELNKLSVKTVAETVEETVIPYGVTEIKNEDGLIGSRDVIIEGRNGMGNRVTTVVYIDGVQQGDPETKEVVVLAPVDEAVSVGVSVPVSDEEITSLPGSGYVFPLATKRWEVSAYFGDGRGHKGIDLAAKYGTPILAVASGKVIRSEWYEGYGYCVDIDHGFGFVTRYGHASQLIAEVGQTVSAGEVIALVGSTGDSTGDHLHIEFIVGDTKLNPAMYLGLD